MKKKYFPRINNYFFPFLTISLLVFSNTKVFSQENDRDDDEKEIEKNEVVPDNPFEDQFYKMRMNKDGIVPDFSPSLKNSGGNISVNSTGLINFNFIGPYSYAARTRALLVSRNNSNLIFAGGTTGGLFRSTDKGATWTPVDDQALNLNVTCITQNKFNPDIIYYGTGEFVGNHTGLAGAGVFKSVDGGITFTQLSSTNNSSFEYCKCIYHSLTDSNTVFVGTDNSGLFRSTDGGVTFIKVHTTTKRITDVKCFPDGKVWIGVDKGGVYGSLTGNSGTFTKFISTLPTGGFSPVAVAYCDSVPNTAYAAFGDTLSGFNSGLKGIWRTTDGGLNWTQRTNPDSIYDFFFPKLNLCLVVKPDNANFVICGAADLTYSSNGGSTWKIINSLHVDQHSVTFDPNDLTHFYNGTDGGIGRYPINMLGYNGENMNRGYDVAQYYAGSFFPAGISCLMGSQDNNTHRCLNNDSIFTKINASGINGCFTAVNQQNQNISYISGNNGAILRSDNSLDSIPVYTSVLNNLDGNNDGSIDDNTWQVNPFEINLLDGNQLYFVTQQHIWRTTNGAAAWTPITNTINSTTPAYCIGLSNDTFPTLYAGGQEGLFLRINNAYSATAGSEANLSSSIPPSVSSDFISCLTVHPGNAGIVYASFSTVNNLPRIWKITNANTALPVWTNISGNLPLGLSINWIEVDPKNPDSVLIAATAYGLYTTKNGGATWNKETSIPNVAIPNIRVRKSDNKLFIFTHGRGVWTADLHINCNAVLTAGTVTSTTAKVTWSPDCSDNWKIRLRKAGVVNWTSFLTDSTSKTWMNLDSGTTYEVQVQAYINSVNYGDWSPSLFFTTLYTCPLPTGLSTSNITVTSAKLKWTNNVSAKKTIRYRKTGAANWVSPTISVGKLAVNYTLQGLDTNTNYEWQIKTKCTSANGSAWSVKKTFKTLNVIRFSDNSGQDNAQLIISPNPNKGRFNVKTLSDFNGKTTLIVADSKDQEILRKELQQTSGELNIDLDLSKQQSGVYFITLMSGTKVISKKFIIE